MSMNRQPPLDPGEESSLAPLTQMAVELSKTPAEALCRLMAKEFLRRKGGKEFFCMYRGAIVKKLPSKLFFNSRQSLAIDCLKPQDYFSE